jgi:hypothetical protein
MEIVSQYITWLNQHWVEVGVVFYFADKAVKISPWKGDDVIVDVIYKMLKKLVGK